MNFKIYKSLFRYRHSTLCEMFARLEKEAGVLKEVEIHLHDRSNGTILGTCTANADISIINIYVDKDRKYPYWFCHKHHPHAVRIKTELDFINLIVAHELYHITGGNPRNFEWAKKKKHLRAMEECCDSFAAKVNNIRVFKYGKYYIDLLIGSVVGAIIGYFIAMLIL